MAGQEVMLKRRYIRIRIEGGGLAAGVPAERIREARIVDVQNGRNLERRIPYHYGERLLTAQPGDRVRAWMFDAPPKWKYARGRRRRGEIRLEPVVLRVVNVVHSRG